MRKQPLMHLGILSMIIQAVLVAWLYPIFYRGGRPAIQGMRFGLAMGLFMGSYGVLAEAGKFDVGPVGRWIVLEGVYFLLQFAIVGAAIGRIHGTRPREAGSA